MIPSFPTTVAERMAEFCEHFEVEPCKLRYSRRATDDILMTDELLDWHKVNGASLDWICIGSVTPMMAAYRNEALQRRCEREALRHLTDIEVKALRVVLQAVLDGGLEVGPALELWKSECAKRQEEVAE